MFLSSTNLVYQLGVKRKCSGKFDCRLPKFADSVVHTCAASFFPFDNLRLYFIQMSICSNISRGQGELESNPGVTGLKSA